MLIPVICRRSYPQLKGYQTQLVEAATGRRTRGANTFAATPAPEARATPTPEAGRVASSTVTFANHPADPERDRGHAEAYARGMTAKVLSMEEMQVFTSAIWALYYEPFIHGYSWEQLERHATLIYQFINWHDLLGITKPN